MDAILFTVSVPIKDAASIQKLSFFVSLCTLVHFNLNCSLTYSKNKRNWTKRRYSRPFLRLFLYVLYWQEYGKQIEQEIESLMVCVENFLFLLLKKSLAHLLCNVGHQSHSHFRIDSTKFLDKTNHLRTPTFSYQQHGGTCILCI